MNFFFDRTDMDKGNTYIIFITPRVPAILARNPSDYIIHVYLRFRCVYLFSLSLSFSFDDSLCVLETYW